MFVRDILGVCIVSGSIGGSVFVFNGHSEEAHMRYMSGCVPLLATFAAHEAGYRRVSPPYRTKDEAAARLICQDRWSKRLPIPSLPVGCELGSQWNFPADVPYPPYDFVPSLGVPFAGWSIGSEWEYRCQFIVLSQLKIF